MERLSVIFIVIGNGTRDLSSNPGRGCLHFTLCQYLWERHESIYSMSLIGQASCFTKAKEPSVGENSEFKPILHHLKNSSCHILPIAEELSKYMWQTDFLFRFDTQTSFYFLHLMLVREENPSSHNYEWKSGSKFLTHFFHLLRDSLL